MQPQLSQMITRSTSSYSSKAAALSGKSAGSRPKNARHAETMGNKKDKSPSTSKGAPASIRVTHPRTIFKDQMTVLRRKYQLEVASKALVTTKEAKEALVSNQKLQQTQAADIKIFKKEREAYLRGIDAFTAPIYAMPTPIDSVLGHQKSTSSKSTSSKSTASKGGDEVDLVFRERRKQWAQYCDERRNRRYHNLVTHKLQESKTRLDALTYLYYSASNFVTYSNLDGKVAEALRLGADTQATVNEMLVAAEIRDATDDTTGVFGSSSSWITNGSTRNELTRQDALKSALMGTLPSGDMDAETIKEKHKVRKQAASMSADSVIPESEQFGK
ncbi:hypothetical protein BASA61_004466 [Batrachochytrium salamandrivorans]|nr:hypothetical protein BASA61_004466 [Batrachochytrium salamandrivorans]